MKVTTVRFSEDLWEAIGVEAERAGVSASQFIREAALARAAAAAGSRGEVLFDPLAAAVQGDDPPWREVGHQPEVQRALAVLSRALTANTRSESEALRAQSRQAVRFARRQRARKTELDLGDQPDPQERSG
jgi:hypothetical protein